MPAHGEKLGPRALLRAEAGEPFRPLEYYIRKIGEGLHVVYDRGALIQAHRRREGWFKPRLSPLALQRLEHARLLAADVSACSPVEDDIQVVAFSQDVLAQVIMLDGLFDGLFQHPVGFHELAPDVNERPVRPDGIAGNGHPFQEHVRVVLHYPAVLEGPRLPLIGITGQVLGFRGILGHEAPLQPGGEPRSPPTPQTGFLHLFYQLVGGELVKRPG